MKVVNIKNIPEIYIKCPKCHYLQHFDAGSETEEENILEKENPPFGTHEWLLCRALNGYRTRQDLCRELGGR